jgi:hypothetical protein
MRTVQEIRLIREAVGLFHRNEDLQGAIDDCSVPVSIGLSLGCSPAKPLYGKSWAPSSRTLAHLLTILRSRVQPMSHPRPSAMPRAG